MAPVTSGFAARVVWPYTVAIVKTGTWHLLLPPCRGSRGRKTAARKKEGRKVYIHTPEVVGLCHAFSIVSRWLACSIHC